MNYLSKSLEYKNVHITHKILDKIVSIYPTSETTSESEEFSDINNRIISIGEIKTTALIYSIEEIGRIDIVEKLLQINGIDVDAKNEAGETALVYTCYSGKIDIFNLLLSKGASIDLKDDEDSTILITTCNSKPNENTNLIIKSLLDKNIDVNLIDKRGFTALEVACFMGNIEIVQILLEKIKDVELKNETCEKCFSKLFHWESDKIGILKILLENSTIDIINKLILSDERFFTYLMKACLLGNLELVEGLLKLKNINVNAVNNNRDTALMVASIRGDIEIVKTLVNNGAEINIKREDGKSALVFACRKGRIEIVEFLLIKADLNNASIIETQRQIISDPNVSYNIKLLLPEFYKHLEEIIPDISDSNIVLKNRILSKPEKMTDKEFLEIKIKYVISLIESERRNKDWFEILIYMIKFVLNKNELESLLFTLIKSFKFPEVETSAEDNIHHFTEEDDIICILNIIFKKHEGDFNSSDALMESCVFGYKKIVKILIDRGADTSKKNDASDTALTLACSAETEQVDIVEILLEKCDAETINWANKDSATSLIFACDRGHFDTVRLLLDNGFVNFNPKCEGTSALMYACKKGYTKIVELILDKIAELKLDTDYDELLRSATSAENDFSTLIYLLDRLKTNGKLLLNEKILEIIYNGKTLLDNDTLLILLFFYGNQIDATYPQITKLKLMHDQILESIGYIIENINRVGVDVIRSKKINIIGEDDKDFAFINKLKEFIILLIDDKTQIPDYESYKPFISVLSKCKVPFTIEDFKKHILPTPFFKKRSLLFDLLVVGKKIDRLQENLLDLKVTYETMKAKLDEGALDEVKNAITRLEAEIESCPRDLINLLLLKSLKIFGVNSLIVEMIVKQYDMNSVFNGVSSCSYISSKYEQLKDEETEKKNFYFDIFKILSNLTNIDDLNNCFVTCSSVEMIDILLKKGVDINFQDEQGNNCLIYASSTGKHEIISHLLSNKADINIVDKKGNNALYYAIHYGEFHSINSLKIMKVLMNGNIDLKNFSYVADDLDYDYEKDDDFNFMLNSIISLKTLEDSILGKIGEIGEDDIAIEIWKECLNNFAYLGCWTTVKKILKYFKDFQVIVDKDFVLEHYKEADFIKMIKEYEYPKKEVIIKILLEEKKDFECVNYITSELDYSLSEITKKFTDQLGNILINLRNDEEVRELEKKFKENDISTLFNVIQIDKINDSIINIFFSKITDFKNLEKILPKTTNYSLIKEKLFVIITEYNNEDSDKKQMNDVIWLLFNFLFEKKDNPEVSTIVNKIINELEISSFEILVNIIRKNNNEVVIEYIENLLAEEEEEESKDKDKKKLLMTYNKNNIHNNKNLNKLINRLQNKGYDDTVRNLIAYKEQMNNHFEEKKDYKSYIIVIIDTIYKKLQLPIQYNNNDYYDLLKICLTNYELVDVMNVKKKYQERSVELISFIQKRESSFRIHLGFEFDSDGFEYIGDKLLKIIVSTQYDEYEKHYLHFLSENKLGSSLKITRDHKQNIQTNLFLHRLMDLHEINEEILKLSTKYYVTIIPNGGSFYKEEKQLVNEYKGGDKSFENIWGADFLEAIIFTLFLYQIKDSSGAPISLENQLQIIVEWWSGFNKLDEITEIINNFKNSITSFLSPPKIPQLPKRDGAFIEEYISDGKCYVNGDEIFENIHDSSEDD